MSALVLSTNNRHHNSIESYIYIERLYLSLGCLNAYLIMQIEFLMLQRMERSQGF